VSSSPHAVAVVDLDAIRDNVGRLVELAGEAAVCAVVKADGYGHGLVPVARAALDGGAGWLGVAFLDEALALRSAGLESPLVAFIVGPGSDLPAALTGQIDVAVGDRARLADLAAAARAVGVPARVHLEADTGLSRGGAPAADWADLVEAAAKAQADGTVSVVGVWSHLACADEPGHPATAGQLAGFAAALELADRAGVHPEVRHLANSAALLTEPAARYDLVRPGIAMYGLSPGPGVAAARFELRPAMTLTSRVALAKRVPGGSGVSYGHRYRTTGETGLALIPLGYGDGIPRAGGGTLEVLLAGARRRIAGTVCMDQFVVDTGADSVGAGDEVVLFGPGSQGEPTADEWADVLGTIGYEIVTRIGPRVARRYLGERP